MYGALESVAVLWRLRSYRDIIIIIIKGGKRASENVSIKKIKVSETFCSALAEQRDGRKVAIPLYGSTGSVACREVCMKHETRPSLTKRATHLCSVQWHG